MFSCSLFCWVASLFSSSGRWRHCSLVLVGGMIVFLFWLVVASLFSCPGGWHDCFLVLVGGVLVFLSWWVA